MQNNKSEVVDLTDIALDFPEPLDDEISRDAMISTVEVLVSDGASLVFVEGREGIGKTIMLAQFARVHGKKTFSLFLGGGSQYNFEIPSIRWNLLNQLHWFLHGKQLPSDSDFVDDSILREKVRTLLRKASLKDNQFYFVVDGVQEAEGDLSTVLDYLYDILPIGAKGISVIISGDQSIPKPEGLKRVKHKTLHVHPFSSSETSDYFEADGVSNIDVQDIHRICKGHPGYLSAVKRLFNAGRSWESLGASLPQELPEIFELEWEAVAHLDNNAELALAVVAFSKSNMTLKDIAVMLGSDDNTLRKSLLSLPFIEINSLEDNVGFASASFKKFAAQKLKHKEAEVSESIVKILESDPEADAALLHIPNYLSTAGQPDKLLEFLSHSHFVRLIERSKSISTVIKQINLGLSVATKNDRVLPLCLAKSSLCEVSAIAGLESEVAANAAIGDKSRALYLAQTAPLKEDRVQLLAAFLRTSAESYHASKSYESIKEEIRSLAEKIDAEAVGEERCTLIAADIFPYFPDVAVNLVERSVESKDNQVERDWALTRMTLTAMVRNETDVDKDDAFGSIVSQLKHSKLKGVFNAAAGFIGATETKEIIAALSEIERTSDKLLLLRQWCRGNSKEDDAVDIVRYAIDLALKDMEYIPGANLYRDLSLPLKYSSNRSSVKEIINIINGQQSLLFEQGPTQDYVELQLSLAEAIRIDSQDLYRDKVCDLYLDCVIRLEDPVQRLGALSAMSAHLKRIDYEQSLQESDGLHDLVEGDWLDAIDEVLKATAEQFGAVENSIKYLAPVSLGQAVNLADKLNTKPRRDDAYLAIVEEVIEEGEEYDWDAIKTICKKIKNGDLRDQAFLVAIKKYSREFRAEPGAVSPTFWYDDIKSILSPSIRVSALGALYRAVLNGPDKCPNLLKDILSNIDRSLKAIDFPKVALETRFNLVCELAEDSPDIAETYLTATQEIRDSAGAEAEMASSAVGYATVLAIRAFSGLLQSRAPEAGDIEILKKTINCFSSVRQKAFFWNLVIASYYLAGRADDCRRMFFKEVDPLLEKAKASSPVIYEKTVVIVSVAYWVAHQGSAVDCISKLSWPYKDRALHSVAQFLLRRVLPGDPVDDLGRGIREHDYADIIDIAKALEYMDDDSCFYYSFASAVDAVSRAKDRKKITGEQYLALKTHLTELVNKSLPKLEFIQHDGYLIACEAKLGTLKGMSWPEWSDLVSRAESLPNESDKAFVLAITASCIPSKHHKHKIEVFRKAKEIADHISSPADQLSRYQSIAEFAWDVEPKISHECLREGIFRHEKNSGDAVREGKRKLIDLAYQIDSDLPGQLIGMLDDDPARLETKRHLQERSRFLEMRKGLSEESRDLDRLALKQLKDLPQAAWKNLGLLNAGKAVPLGMRQVNTLIPVASRLPLDKSFPVYAWLIQCISIKYQETNQAHEYLRPIFLAACANAEFVYSFVKSAKGDFDLSSLEEELEISDDSVLNVREGERDRALNWIRDWLDSNGINNVTVADPFFGPDDLQLLQIIKLINTKAIVTVLTSEKHQRSEMGDSDWSEIYSAKWRKDFSDLSSPVVDFIILGVDGSGDSPIHDRWLITDNGGIRMGTSFNSLGVGKLSELSILDKDIADAKARELDQYILRRVKEVGGKELRYKRFSL